jgi:ABC-type Fe3+-hydroxamate transport system substrate-binding protein
MIGRMRSRGSGISLRPGSTAWIAVLAALALTLLLTACGEKPEPTGVRVSPYPVSVRGADEHDATLTSAPTRIGIVGAAPGALVKALALEATQVGDGAGRISPQALDGLRPQLIIAGSEIDPTALAQARGKGIPVYVTPDRTLEQVEEAVTDVSLLTGVPLRGRAIRARMVAAARKIRVAIAGESPVRVFFDAGGFTTVSDGSFVGDLIREAGGLNVAGLDSEGPFDLKRLARLRPEVILAKAGDPVTLAGLRRDPLTRRLPAVRAGRLVRVNGNLLVPGPDAIQVLRGLAAALHPDAFR